MYAAVRRRAATAQPDVAAPMDLADARAAL